MVYHHDLSSIHSHKVDHEEIAAKAPELLDALQHAEVGFSPHAGPGYKVSKVL